jgi:hypothetical protein
MIRAPTMDPQSPHEDLGDLLAKFESTARAFLGELPSRPGESPSQAHRRLQELEDLRNRGRTFASAGREKALRDWERLSSEERGWVERMLRLRADARRAWQALRNWAGEHHGWAEDEVLMGRLRKCLDGDTEFARLTGRLALDWTTLLDIDPLIKDLLADEQGLLDRYYALGDVVIRLEAQDRLRDAILEMRRAFAVGLYASAVTFARATIDAAVHQWLRHHDLVPADTVPDWSGEHRRPQGDPLGGSAEGDGKLFKRHAFDLAERAQEIRKQGSAAVHLLPDCEDPEEWARSNLRAALQLIVDLFERAPGPRGTRGPRGPSMSSIRLVNSRGNRGS